VGFIAPRFSPLYYGCCPSLWGELEGFAALRRSGQLLAVERLGLNLAVLLQENFYLAFGFLQLFPAGSRKLHSFFEKSQRFFQGDFALFQLLNNFFQALDTLFKFWQEKNSLRAFYTRFCGNDWTFNRAKVFAAEEPLRLDAIQGLQAKKQVPLPLCGFGMTSV
jgi:hypothetical protein